MKEHWEKLFSTKAENEVSWYQPYPTVSLSFIEGLELPLDAAIIDIGGGDSLLVDVLLEKGYTNLYVLDISANALERARRRLGEKAALVHWIVSDITEFVPDTRFDCWHDRAAFHFLTKPAQVAKYAAIAEKAVKPDGHMIIGTFSETGPTKCSGLEIRQYNAETLCSCFQPAFRLESSLRVNHYTPTGAEQNFIFCDFILLPPPEASA